MRTTDLHTRRPVGDKLLERWRHADDYPLVWNECKPWAAVDSALNTLSTPLFNHPAIAYHHEHQRCRAAGTNDDLHPCQRMKPAKEATNHYSGCYDERSDEHVRRRDAAM